MKLLNRHMRRGISFALRSNLDSQRTDEIRLPIVHDAERHAAVEACQFRIETRAPIPRVAKILAVEEPNDMLGEPTRHHSRGAIPYPVEFVAENTKGTGEL